MLEFKLPEVGENIKSGTVVRISVAVGDSVKKGQTLFEFETDKASLEVPSPADGTIKEILIKEGQEAKIGQLVMKIDEVAGGGAAAPAPKAAPASAPQPTSAPKASSPAPRPAAQAAPAAPAPSVAPMQILPANPGRDVAAAPSVRRLAREIGIDITQVIGTGPSGRVSMDDVKNFSKQLNLGRMAQGGGAPAQRPLPDFSKFGQIQKEAMNNVRKKTAEHLSYCWQTIPHVTQFDKADITELEKLRKQYSTEERKLTITPFLLKIMASALKKFPKFNSSIDMTNNQVIQKSYYNLGVAVDTDRGLLVPVVKDVDKKNIMQISDEVNQMAERARNKKTTLEEMSGGCMTLTNLGGIGGTYFTPIVNWPEVCILGISRASWEPVYSKEKNQFEPRFKLPLSLSYDHRLIDGADGARFLRWIVEAIEQPMLLEMQG